MFSSRLPEFKQFYINNQLLKEGKIVPGQLIVITSEELCDLQYQAAVNAAIAGATYEEIKEHLNRFLDSYYHQKLFDRFLVDLNHHDKPGVVSVKSEIINRKHTSNILNLIKTKQSELEMKLSQCPGESHKPNSPKEYKRKTGFKPCPTCDETIQQSKHEQNVLEGILVERVKKQPEHISSLPFGTFCHLITESDIAAESKSATGLAIGAGPGASVV